MPENLRKYLIAAAVVLVLIGAPFGSYFYLKYGLEYRLESQEQLKPKEVDASVIRAIKELVPYGTAALIHTRGDEDTKGIELLNKVGERIVDRDYFAIYSSAASTNFDKISKVTSDPSAKMKDLIDDHFILIDSAGIVRNTYPGNKDISKELIRHLSVVIPLPKNREIKLERELED